MKLNKKLRTILVILFIIIYLLVTYISLRGQYLEQLELGEQYVQAFLTNIKCKYIIMGISFILLSIIMLLTNLGIKKGLKPFFEQENKPMPKLPNKSLVFVISAIGSVILANNLLEKILLCTSNVSFEKTDIIFGLDISYYMFIKPLISIILECLIKIVMGISLYMTAYYILVFNFCFNAVDRKLLRESKLIKNLLRNAIFFMLLFAGKTILGVQDIVFGKFLTLSNDMELTGAGIVESTVQLWGYVGLAVVMTIAVLVGIKFFQKNQNKKVIISLLTVPIYLVLLFIAMVGFDFIFVRSNEFDKEKKYIGENIKATKDAYGIDVEETSIDYSGTITEDEIRENSGVINNIPVVSQNMVLQSLNDSQTNSGYYTFRKLSIEKYKKDDEEKLAYVTPREIVSSTTSYNNKTYEYTHGMGQIIVSASETAEDGNIQYVQNEITGSDNVQNITEPRIYYGLETNSIAVTNTTNKTEYDYTDNDGIEYTYNYNGDSGIQVNFIDRLILAIKNKDIKLAMSNTVTNESKILTNRNIIERAKTALPYIIYDENPYTVVSDGQIYWVVDGYTLSDQYPYSTYSEIEYNNSKQKLKLNYIRNSVKVIINAYNGEMTFYITDRTDPIIMAYLKLYPTIFADYSKKEIPEDIKQQFQYPQFLYKIQANMLKVYHNVKEDVLYRNSDIWAYATYGTTSSKTKTSVLEPYTAIIKTPDTDENKFGLVQIYTQNGKNNISSYLIGTYNGTQPTLKIYKYPADSNILGPTQLDTQIEQDETISAELNSINITGSRITKEMKIIPINNTILYVESIYQTMANEPDKPTTLKKVIVASGTKVAIGDTLKDSLKKLLSQSAGNIEITNTDDMEGILKAIINANKNLTESNNRNDWEMMGSDIKELQELITSLEKKMKETTTVETQTSND